MDKKQTAKKIFSECREYIGPALAIIRFGKGVSRKKLALMLQERSEFTFVTANMIRDMELRKVEMKFEQLLIDICDILNCPLEEFLRCAMSMKPSPKE